MVLVTDYTQRNRTMHNWGGPFVTSLVAWSGVDSRGQASMYFASDSRITWRSSGGVWDFGRKLFASEITADIFGYCGEVLFPSLVLGQVQSLLAGGLFKRDADARSRHEGIRDVIKRSFSFFPNEARKEFTILHAARDGSQMRSAFHLWRLDWSSDAEWGEVEITLAEESALVLAVGSGARVTTDWNDEWCRRLGRTSRSVFGSFCDALDSGSDANTGGAPQLVGLYRVGYGRTFGIVHKEQRFIHGLPLDRCPDADSLEWRNTLFERCDCNTMHRSLNAQPQPHPGPL
jgi:hypothetical protein